ncbi:hypothetical protein FNV43_RR01984 [Rhamnella rubrinervis]|uniref:non-specific serine/threonine protein kinase n=1 Tax=Rhamnella rubrinervis TaxID=2594499 RepID=A0A8K0MSU0_9ROSA|nr:hypothetical protein FNV43_RR01984 [Rhamnella rubrinervis]
MFLGFSTCLYTTSITQPIRDGDGGGNVLVSSGETFALGFFSPGKSITAMSEFGNLVLFDNNDQTFPVWSTNSLSLPTNECATAQLLDSGNLVLFQNESKQLLWQSFDYPTDTQLANMKLGLDRRTGLNWFLTSWKSEDDPRIGNYTLRIDPAGSPQLILYRGQVPWFRLSLEACEKECLRSCNCTAYASVNISEGGSGCIAWHGDLVDTRIFTAGGQDFYLRVDEPQYTKKSKGSVATKRIHIIMVGLGVIIFIIISSIAYWFAKMKRKGASPTEENLEESRTHPDLPFFDIRTLITATDNFSATNMLGQGGFGSVYKGQLVNGQEIAVKRLSKHSGQGMHEFMNELTVIAKLQHRNLVRLLGYFIHEEEKMLICEYLPNKSLDHFIFDLTRRAHMDWSKRFEIVSRIARGILYLHQDSRLKIIHRDLKASNVLLDASMNLKISDFGMAKMFGEDQIQEKTKRVVGTYGYMAPEYAMQGLYSTKSDVFSFGVLLLEIISSRKITECINGSQFLNLIGHVWELWNDGRVLDIVDPALCQAFSTDEVSRCIHIGLLCVQEAATQRPTMSDVIFMLANETLFLLQTHLLLLSIMPIHQNLYQELFRGIGFQ